MAAHEIGRGRIRVYYHANCMDGITAAWVAWKAFNQGKYVGTQFEAMPAQYQATQPEDCAGKIVYVLDFSWPPEVLFKLREEAGFLLVLDHHDSAPHVAQFGIYDPERCGASLAWDYFFGDLPRPLIVQYAEDRDLWRHKLPDSREVAALMQSYCKEVFSWDKLAQRLEAEFKGNGFSDAFLGQARAILAYQERVIENAVARARPVTLDGREFLAVNAAELQSEIAHRLALRSRDGCGAVYYRSKNGAWIWSLRSNAVDGQPPVRVNGIAKRRGGGGHPTAAGFMAEVLG